MAIKFYKPTTPSRRKTTVVSGLDLTKKKKREKSLCERIKRYSGRNNQGRITVRHRGGGAKKIYRQVDFKQLMFDVPAIVEAIEYDPNRNARIALIKYKNTESTENTKTQKTPQHLNISTSKQNSKSYILAAVGMKVGDVVASSDKKIEIKTGNRMPLEFVPQGQMVYNVELEPKRGGKLARSAGSYVIAQGTEGKYAQLKMPSGEIRLVSKNCLASIGQASNPEAKLVRIGKAGRKRHMGIKPTVRGKAMNPVDHPHGGGEGSQPVGMKAPKTPWGKKALGVKTRGKKWTDKLIIKRRRHRK